MGEEEEAEEEEEKKEEKGKREDKYRTVSVRRSTPSFRQAERAFASLCKPPRKVRPCGGPLRVPSARSPALPRASDSSFLCMHTQALRCTHIHTHIYTFAHIHISMHAYTNVYM